jgi:hypothetical protein
MGTAPNRPKKILLRSLSFVIDVAHTNNMRRWYEQALENMGEYLRVRRRCMNTMYFGARFSPDPSCNSKGVVIVCCCKNNLFSPICIAGTDYALARARSTDQRTR